MTVPNKKMKRYYLSTFKVKLSKTDPSVKNCESEHFFLPPH